ncbi:hypothetical protein [Nocardia pseudovaccinii]|uniref:hypothetical protein n=1 Tax=Nocardia pseudovaccinii TaxID=189540 RepID=UPI0007A4DDB2|nr:hypothetical protein [Nocardia pseudovaccinii]
MSRKKRRATIGLSGAAAITAAAVALTACSSDSGPTRDDGGRAGTVTAASSSGNADPLKASGIAIGVGDRPGATLVTRPTPEQVTARCHGQGDGLTAEVTALNGWHVLLKQGSQTITVENKTLHYPSADITTAATTIAMSKKLSGNRFPLGLTWGRPGPGDVEIQVSEDAPTSWTTTSPDTDFTMFMHISCPAAS